MLGGTAFIIALGGTAFIIVLGGTACSAGRYCM